MIINNALILDAVENSGPDYPLVGWKNLATAGSIATDTALANYPASNLANPATYLQWKAADQSDQHITVTLDGVTATDFVGIAKHNFGSAQIPVSIEGYISGTWTLLAGPLIPADDTPLLFRYTPQALPQVRIRLQPGNAAANAAVIYVGKLLIVERKIYFGHTPLPHARKSTISNGASESGNFLGRIVLGSWRETTAHFERITPAWYRANMDAFFATVKETPFFFAWRPQSYPAEVGYGWLIDDPMPTPDDQNDNLLMFDLHLGGIA